MGGFIESVKKGLPAFNSGIKSGDILLSINGRTVNDTLDYMFFSSAKRLTLKILRDGSELEFAIKKREEAPLGIVFRDVLFDKIKLCRNKCDFCFVDQDPRDARTTMQIKDDDYRLSFLCGNFITLTNLAEADWAKIEEFRLSPLYVSVHATEPEVRINLMKNKNAGLILDNLRRLVDIGITVHAQIVLCPDINDGLHLEKTLSDLAGLYPAVASAAIVPVGLTKYHCENSVRSFTTEEMKDIIKLAEAFQKAFYKKNRETFLYLADEFFIKTETPIPPLKYYGDFPQYENGIGMMRTFLTDFNRQKRFIPKEISSSRQVSIVTGMLAFGHMKEIVSAFENVNNLKIKLHGAESIFWGRKVDVAGLLTGTDIKNAIISQNAYEDVIIPSICINDRGFFLDGYTLERLQNETNRRIIPVKPDFLPFRKAVLYDDYRN